ncbi:MAG: PIN domain-containing protein [Actinobacteria bacterium]|nr:PIN domain-containing protein [Actinomycetota bacterium]MCB9389462.1 PIN domain-containing protein [Acidimicrobiia bacterium]
MSRPVAVLDANVLYPARLRDLLMRLAIASLYRARWSEEILDECFTNILKHRPDLTEPQLARTRRLVSEALPDASVTGYQHRINDFQLLDPHDRHILAAAVTARASLVVTNNLRDFPPELPEHGINVVSADQFITHLATEDVGVVARVVEAPARGLSSPRMTTMNSLTDLPPSTSPSSSP